MNTFYGLAQTKDDATRVLELNSTLYHRAVKEARQLCKEKGLTFKTIYKEQGSEKGGSTLTKFARQRKKDRGIGKHVESKY